MTSGSTCQASRFSWWTTIRQTERPKSVRGIGERLDRVHVISRIGQRGYGSATLVGLRYAIEHGFDAVLTLDADYSHDPADLPRLAKALSVADVAIGSRYVGGVRVLNWEIYRLLLSLLANTYVRFLSGLQCTDCTSGFRAYRVNALKRAALDKVQASGYAFLPELLFNIDDATVNEVPICYTERRLGQSKMSRRVIAEAIVRPWVLGLKRLTRSTRRRFRRRLPSVLLGPNEPDSNQNPQRTC